MFQACGSCRFNLSAFMDFSSLRARLTLLPKNPNGTIEIAPIDPPDGVDGSKLRCPKCDLEMGKLTPQHAHTHNLTVNAMRNLYPEVGVNKPAQVSILPNIKNLLGEEVSFKLVAGARTRDVYELPELRISLE